MASQPWIKTQFLPENREFQDLLYPFLVPYLVYVAVSSIPESILPAEFGQGVKLVLTGVALFYFRKAYRFGAFKPMHLYVSIAALPIAMALWVGPFYLLSIPGWFEITTATPGESFSPLFFVLRLCNAVFLVAVFEELFIRVYVMGWLYQAALKRGGKGWIAAITDTLDRRPMALEKLPISRFSVIGSTIVFAAGHHVYEYLSCSLFFLFTTWLYQKSGSLWVCIIVHGLTNLTIGILVQQFGMVWLW